MVLGEGTPAVTGAAYDAHGQMTPGFTNEIIQASQMPFPWCS
jgi:hypothetical protein